MEKNLTLEYIGLGVISFMTTGALLKII